MRYLLDTHVWLWAQLQPEQLSRAAFDLLSTAIEGACLSPMTFYEVLLLAERGRIRLEMPPTDWVRTSLARRPMHVLDVTTEIALQARDLVGYENPDPFDRFLLATARIHQIPVVTKDESMRRWGGVSTIW